MGVTKKQWNKIRWGGLQNLIKQGKRSLLWYHAITIDTIYIIHTYTFNVLFYTAFYNLIARILVNFHLIARPCHTVINKRDNDTFYVYQKKNIFR